MNIKNAAITILAFAVCGLAAHAELVLRTSDAPGPSGDYTTGPADNGVNSQNVNTLYRVGGLGLRHANANRIIMPFVRFDISDVKGQDFSDAVLSLYIGWVSKTFTMTFDVWGIIDGSEDYWNSGALTWNTATTPKSSGGLGWMTWTTDGSGQYTNFTINNQIWQYLGTWTIYAPVSGNLWVSSSPSNLNLNDFIANDTNGLVTLTLAHSANANYWCGINGAEAPATAPMLTFPHALPKGASSPQPANGSTLVKFDDLTQLCWKNWAVDRYEVWFGPANADAGNYKSLLTKIAVLDNPPAGDLCADIPSEMLPLMVPQTYTWVLDAYVYPAADPNHTGEPNSLYASSLFQFHTSAVPVLVASPVEQFKFPGETAIFTAQFTSVAPINQAVWYKVGNPDAALNPANPNVAVDIANGTSNLYTITLTLSNVTAADEGQYYCIASTNGIQSPPSASAYLLVKRRIAYWPFDGSAADMQGSYNGTLMGDPAFTDGKVGQALVFDSTDDMVALPGGFPNFRSGLTFAAWVNPSRAANNAAFFDLGNGENAQNIRLSRVRISNDLRFTTTSGTLNAAGALAQNEWQFIVVAMPESGNTVIYKNGTQIASGAVARPAVINRQSNYIGKSGWSGAELFEGMMDDVQLFNYAVTAADVLNMYVAAAGPFCQTRPSRDYNGDCVVDISDLTFFAAEWLSDGYWPQSMFQK